MHKFLNLIGLDGEARAFFGRHKLATIALVVFALLSVVVSHNGWVLWAGATIGVAVWLHSEAKREESEQDSDLDE